MADRFESDRRNSFSHERFHLPEIFVCTDLEFLGRPPLFDLRCRSFGLVKSVQTRDNTIDFRLSDQTFGEQFTQERAGRQLFHHDAVLSNFALCFEGKAGSAFVDGDHSQIHFRTEPAIQLDLPFAKMTTFFQSAEIKKPKIHGLLHLEDKRRGNEDPRDVRLHRGHFRRPVWIRSRRFQERNQPLLQFQ